MFGLIAVLGQSEAPSFMREMMRGILWMLAVVLVLLVLAIVWTKRS